MVFWNPRRQRQVDMDGEIQRLKAKGDYSGLLHALDTSHNQDIRKRAALAMAHTNHAPEPAILDRLLTIARSDQDLDVRQAAAESAMALIAQRDGLIRKNLTSIHKPDAIRSPMMGTLHSPMPEIRIRSWESFAINSQLAQESAGGSVHPQSPANLKGDSFPSSS